jgi:hypothetical protein
MGVGDDFARFCRALRIPPNSRALIAWRTAAITKRLNYDFRFSYSETDNTFYSGSYGRETAIRGVSDIDLLAVLPYETFDRFHRYQNNGQSALLQAVKTSIANRYPRTSLKGDGQVVVVSFDDMAYDVVPVFLNSDGSYTHPDSNDGGRWKVTRPKEEILAFEQRNKETDGNLRELCRMARAWRERNSVPISGMLIDTLSYYFIKDWAYRDKSYFHFDYLSRDFFAYLKSQNSSQSYWKAPGSGQYVYTSGNFTNKARLAFNSATEAISYGERGYTLSARKTWREIYGTDYPNS